MLLLPQVSKYPTSSAALIKAGIEHAAALALGSCQDGLPPAEADAHVASAMLQVGRRAQCADGLVCAAAAGHMQQA